MPETEVLESEAAVEPGALAAAACHGPFLAAWDELETQLDNRLIEVLRAGLAHHREAIDSTGLAGPAPAEWDTRAEHLLAYRRAVASELLEPLATVLEESGPGKTIAMRLTAALKAAVTASKDLPESTVAPFPSGALHPAPSDGRKRRALKFLARGISPARKAGRERDLPLRAVAVQHVREIVAPDQSRVAADALAHWAQWTHRLELAWVGWGDTGLPALIRSESPDAEDPDALWSEIGAAALELHALLEELVESAPHHSAAKAARDRLGASRAVLGADLDVAGSFVLRPGPDKAAPPTLRVAAAAGTFEAWDAGVAARMKLYNSTLSILSGATAVQRRVLWRFRHHCMDKIEELPKVADRLDGLAKEVAALEAGDGLADRMESLEAELRDLLAAATGAIAEPDVVESTVRQGSNSAVEALFAMVRQAPASLPLHAEDAQPPSGSRRVEVRSLALQELTRQSFDALRIERIRTSIEALIDAVDRARKDVADLAEVFAFAHGAAQKELLEGGSKATAEAAGLITEALQSIAEALRHGVRDLEAEAADAQTRLAAEIREGSLGLLDRVAAGRMQAQLLAARSRVADAWAGLQEAWGPAVGRAYRAVVRALVLVPGLATRALGKLRVMGGAPAEQAASTRALKALADRKALTERLPLVYRRLFTLEPLADSTLLTGRDVELADARGRWEAWRDGKGVPLIVRGRQGSGITSFLNVLGKGIEDSGGTVARKALEERASTECELATMLSELLEVELATTLDALSRSVFGAKRGAVPDAVVLDNLEHLYLRVPGGTDLIERLLTLMAETEPRIYWVGGVTTSAWQLVSAVEPTAIQQVDVFDLAPLTEDEVRTAITLRHRRSGLGVRYEEPATAQHRLRRRFRRRRGAHTNEELLEEAYFERLYRTSGGDLGLALFQWLMSAEFGTGDGVWMRLSERPDFAVLDSLDLTQNFTLKAFLEHRTLTLDEHDRIFRLPRQESYQIFESLGNRHLIEAVAGGGASKRSDIDKELRYRVRPLLTGSVISHLRARNIVH